MPDCVLPPFGGAGAEAGRREERRRKEAAGLWMVADRPGVMVQTRAGWGVYR